MTELTPDREYLYKADGSAFADLRAANGQKAYWENQGVITKAVELESGGFALEVIKRRRPGRTPLGERNVLTSHDNDPTYVRRFVKDKPGRVEMFQDAGWEIVHDPRKAGDERVGSTRLPGTASTVTSGSGQGVLVEMRKRRDWYEEDEQVKQDRITEAENGLIRQAQVAGNLHPMSENRPGIQIAHSRKRSGA